METNRDEPLSYWVAVARMGFEDDLHRILDQLGISRAELAKRLGATPAYVSKVLNGSDANYTIETMAKWARSLGAIAQIRLVIDGKEVVRVVDYEIAGVLDDATEKRGLPHSGDLSLGGRLLTFPVPESADSYRSLGSPGRRGVLLSSASSGGR